MRLLLDANLSPRGIATPLQAAGHDVLALAADPTFEGLDDPLVLELAAAEQRVLITRNSRDFAPLAREWAEASRHHAGLILSGRSTTASSPQSSPASGATSNTGQSKSSGATSSSPCESSRRVTTP